MPSKKKSNNHNDKDAELVELYSQDFYTYYNSCLYSNTDEKSRKFVNRCFSLFAKKVFESNDEKQFTDLFNFLDTTDNSIYNDVNVLILMKYFDKYENSIKPYNSEQIIKFIDKLKTIPAKQHVVENIINISSNRFILSANIINKFLELLLILLDSENIWLNNEYVSKCMKIIENNYKVDGNTVYIGSSTFRLDLDLIYKLSHKILKYDMTQFYNTKSNRWNEKVILRQNLITLRKTILNKKINKNMKQLFTENPTLYPALINPNRLNIIVDGRNRFYKPDYPATNNISFNDLRTFDKQYKSIISNVKTNLGAKCDFSGGDNPNILSTQVIYVVFSSIHKELFESTGIVKELKNINIIFTPDGVNDDNYQLYLWLTFKGCVLLTKDKYSNYKDKLNEKKYMLNLFESYYSLFTDKS